MDLTLREGILHVHKLWSQKVYLLFQHIASFFLRKPPSSNDIYTEVHTLRNQKLMFLHLCFIMNAEKITSDFYVYKVLRRPPCHWLFQNIVHLYERTHICIWKHNEIIFVLLYYTSDIVVTEQVLKEH